MSSVSQDSSATTLAVYRSQWTKLFRTLDPAAPAAPPTAVLPARALGIWRQRPDLQNAFDIQTDTGRVDLFWWYLLHGHSELGLNFDELDAATSQAVNLPVPKVPQYGFVPVTWLMREMYRRAGGRFPPFDSADGQKQLLAWFFAKGLTDKRLGPFLTQAQADALREPVTDIPGTTRIADLIWQVDDQVRQRFADVDDPAYGIWCKGEGARDFPILAHPLVGLAEPWRPPSRASGRFGVNLIGHAFHRSGLSEDMRAAALALGAEGVPFAIHDPGASGPIANEDTTLARSVTDDLPFDINLFCFTGMSTVGAVLANPDLSIERRFSIGMWPWELPEWPDFWRHAYDYVDEVWAASRFTYDAYCRSAPVPVRHMPMAVTVDATDGATREDFGLVPGRFLFAFAFDGLSSFARKDPMACVAAFQAAFARNDDSVGLVIKGLRAAGTEAWERLQRQIDNDPRIVNITESLSRGRLLDLYRSIDCFVSLHRSEGFGRNIAEAMLLEKPVIVSAHSGNMDFTDHATAALVPVRLVSLEDGEYPYGDGQTWGRADLTDAIRQMRWMASNTVRRATVAHAGRKRIEELYSPAAVGRHWAKILKDLKL